MLLPMEFSSRTMLEKRLAPVMELLRRQTLVEQLVDRTEDRAGLGADVLHRRHRTALAEALSRLHPADIAHLLEMLPPEERSVVWVSAPPETAGQVLAEVNDTVAEGLVAETNRDRLLAIGERLTPVDLALIEDILPGEVRSRLLSEMDEEDRSWLETTVTYPEDSVGHLMTRDVLVIDAHATVKDVLRYVRTLGDLPDNTDKIFVVDRKRHLVGALPLKALIIHSPKRPVAEVMSRELPLVDGHYVQFEDELASISALVGAAWAGAKAMTATSGPGFALMTELIIHGIMAEIPAVIINAQRGGPSTGLPTRVSQADIGQAQYPTHGDYASITLCAGSLTECYTQTVRAFNLAETYMTPVFMLLDETIGHMHGKAELPDLEEIQASNVKRATNYCDPKDYLPYGAEMNKPAVLNPMFKGYRYHVTGLHHGPTGFPTEDAQQCDFNIKRLVGKINTVSQEKGGLDDHADYEEVLLDDAEVCIIAYS